MPPRVGQGLMIKLLAIMDHERTDIHTDMQHDSDSGMVLGGVHTHRGKNSHTGARGAWGYMYMCVGGAVRTWRWW